MFNKELILQPNTVVHCETEEQANELLKWADGIGQRWFSQESFLKTNHYLYHKNETCYSIYGGRFGNLKSFIRDKYKVLSFNEVIKSNDGSCLNFVKN